MTEQPLQIVMIDNYDSFTYNLVDQFRQLECEVIVFRNDTPLHAIFTPARLKNRKTVIVISPGPGNPQSAGFSLEIIKTYGGVLPILGICLGHQAIVEAFGGTVGKAQAIVHGKADSIFFENHSVFAGLESPLRAARYHSLAATSLPNSLQIIAKSDQEIMGIHHQDQKILGFQFHPESLLTTYGSRLLKNALDWLCQEQPFEMSEPV